MSKVRPRSERLLDQFPHTVGVSFEVQNDLALSFEEGTETPIIEWLEEHFGNPIDPRYYANPRSTRGKWYACENFMGNVTEFRFKSGKDALMFKLRWGGNG